MAGLEEPERLELALLLCMLSANFSKYTESLFPTLTVSNPTYPPKEIMN
jgi:hypothetical protein